MCTHTHTCSTNGGCSSEDFDASGHGAGRVLLKRDGGKLKWYTGLLHGEEEEAVDVDYASEDEMVAVQRCKF